MSSARWAFFLLVFSGCGLFVPDVGGEGQKCRDDGTCNSGLSCVEDKCVSNNVDRDGADGSSGTDGGLDAGDASDQGGDDAPPPCTRDSDCPPDQICEESSGKCLAGTGCQADYNCDIDKEYCDPTGKVCKERSELCGPCQGDYQCPDPGNGDMCISYADSSYCGQACGVLRCPVGYVCDTESGSGSGPNPGQCRSNTGTCGEQFICHEDVDCAANKVCKKETGTCVLKCVSDINCPTGQKCHYTGHCGVPCTGDGDCQVFGADLICCTTPGVGFCDAESTGKCRPEGCVLHAECLLTEGDSLGYCDKRTHTCQTGCRAADAGTVNDCKAGMKCECNSGTVSCDGFDCCSDPASGTCVCDPELQDCSQVNVCDNGTCVEIPCTERGDVELACARNQLCCGWPEDGYSCPGEFGAGQCYTAEKSQWCASCAEEGKTCEAGDLGHGEPGICLSNPDENLTCRPACRDQQDCPVGWECRYALVQGCENQDECESTAVCDTALITAEEEVHKACLCESDDDCPLDINGFRAHCDYIQICDHTQNPADCHQGKACMWAKTCQCTNCCSEIP